MHIDLSPIVEKASFSVDLRGSDLGRKWERRTLHNHDIKYTGFVMNMEYLKTWLTPAKYIKQNSMGDSPSYNLTVALPCNQQGVGCMETKGSLPS
jgi:hypothetical protein